MDKNRTFSSENLMMSVCGHLAVLAVLVTSFAIVFNDKPIVSPDRIEIIEIDLSRVKISGDETRLYNTDTPDVKPVETPKEKEPEPTPQPEPVAEDKPVETPSLIVDEPKKDEKKPNNESEKKQVESDKNVPKKKTVVKVNRQVMSLDRTLTVSVVDALRVAMTRCWNIDTSRPDISDIRAVAYLTLRKNGTVRDVWFESASRADNDAAFAYVLDTIRNAINVCQPFDMLPANEFDTWEKIQLTFYPTTGKVM